MSAHPIGTVDLDGRVTCNLCPWQASDRLDPVGALSAHRVADHPNTTPTKPKTPAAAPAVRRDPAGAVLGLALLLGFGWLAYSAWTAGGWWIAAAIPCALMAALGTYGLTSDLQRAPRDGRGRRLR